MSSVVDLPPELLANVFSYLGDKELALCHSVCKTFDTRAQVQTAARCVCETLRGHRGLEDPDRN